MKNIHTIALGNTCEQCGASPAFFAKLNGKILCDSCFRKLMLKYIAAALIIGLIIFNLFVKPLEVEKKEHNQTKKPLQMSWTMQNSQK